MKIDENDRFEINYNFMIRNVNGIKLSIYNISWIIICINYIREILNVKRENMGNNFI